MQLADRFGGEFNSVDGAVHFDAGIGQRLAALARDQ